MEEITFRKLRLRNQCTHKEIADYIGVKIGTYYKYEEFARLPSISRLKKLKEIYRCTDEELTSAYIFHKKNMMIKHFNK